MTHIRDMDLIPGGQGVVQPLPKRPIGGPWPIARGGIPKKCTTVTGITIVYYKKNFSLPLPIIR